MPNLHPLISICIPAYKRTHYLRRLLTSIAQQTFTNFEVIVTDDSGNDNNVAALVKEFDSAFALRYYKNTISRGTPANWNEGISKANGEWIKLIHDDDWLASPTSLQNFADATSHGKKFIFSAYTNHYEDENTTETVRMTVFWRRNIKKNPSTLLAKNVIGPPSVTMVHQSVKETYDERLKWRVDTDFYERVLRAENTFYYTDQPLMNVGISKSQVTQSCLYKPEVELPEGLTLLQKYGVSSLQNIWVYDAWWRLFRNMNIKNGRTIKRLHKRTLATRYLTSDKRLVAGAGCNA